MSDRQINPTQLKLSANQIKALAHPLRLSILLFIDKNKSVNVNKIYNTLKLEQSITSQHLKILRTAGIVNYQREGKLIFYSVNYNKVKRIVDLVNDFVNR